MKVKPSFKLALLRSLNKRSHHPDGFTLIEVIVAIVILSIFIVASLTALVTGLNFKLKAKLNNEATLLIQQDLEQVRYQATQVGLQVKVNGTPTVIVASPNTSSTTLTTTTSVTSTIDLGLTIPIIISGTQTYLTTANTGLSISGENSAYRLTSDQTPTTSLAVTINLGSVSSLNSTQLANASSGTSTSITVPTESVSKFKDGDRIVVGPQPPTTATPNPTAIFSGIVIGNPTVNPISFGTVTVPSYPVDTRVTILPRSGDLITNKDLCTNATTNIATTFIDSLSTTNGTGKNLTFDTTFNQRAYKLRREAITTSTTRAKITYKVAEATSLTACLADSTACLATLTTEVIPSVALKCP